MFDEAETTGTTETTGTASAADEPGTERTIQLPGDDRPTKSSTAFSWAITIGVAIVLTVLVRTFLFQAYSIPSPSMVPTLAVGDRVLVAQLNTDPARGDIIVFDRPENDPKTNEDDPDVLIKRVIGLPGETITADSAGSVYVDGTKLKEDYLPAGTKTIMTDKIVVPEGKILVLGDNRGESLDGRVFGPIDKDLIVGRAIARIWPFSRAGGL